MGHDRDPWHYSDNPTTVARGFTWRAMVWVVAVVLFIAALSWAGWHFKVFTSEYKGAGDAQVEINKGDNQIQSQELFEDLYRKVLEYDKNLDVLAAAVKRNPSSFNNTNYDAGVMNCNSAVEQYDAEVRKISSGKWRAKDLPESIDITNPLTDCKENSK